MKIYLLLKTSPITNGWIYWINARKCLNPNQIKTKFFLDKFNRKNAMKIIYYQKKQHLILDYW